MIKSVSFFVETGSLNTPYFAEGVFGLWMVKRALHTSQLPSSREEREEEDGKSTNVTKCDVDEILKHFWTLETLPGSHQRDSSWRLKRSHAAR